MFSKRLPDFFSTYTCMQSLFFATKEVFYEFTRTDRKKVKSPHRQSFFILTAHIALQPLFFNNDGDNFSKIFPIRHELLILSILKVQVIFLQSFVYIICWKIAFREIFHAIFSLRLFLARLLKRDTRSIDGEKKSCQKSKSALYIYIRN